MVLTKYLEVFALAATWELVREMLIFIARVVEAEDTHSLGRTGNQARDWTDQE